MPVKPRAQEQTEAVVDQFRITGDQAVTQLHQVTIHRQRLILRCACKRIGHQRLLTPRLFIPASGYKYRPGRCRDDHNSLRLRSTCAGVIVSPSMPHNRHAQGRSIYCASSGASSGAVVNLYIPLFSGAVGSNRDLPKSLPHEICRGCDPWNTASTRWPRGLLLSAVLNHLRAPGKALRKTSMRQGEIICSLGARAA